jgi:protein-L-isoaspartate(D-aspartate) O-methyltransferase
MSALEARPHDEQDGTDGVHAEGARTLQFLLTLRAQGVADLAVLRAMERVPRDVFAPARYRDLSRTDVSIPLPCGQTMTPPGVVASLLVSLAVSADQRVLEVGAGSGYVTALLATMGAHVLSLERYRSLALAAHERLSGLRLRQIELQHADGLNPTRLLGRFDRILMNGAVDAIPQALLQRLAPGGKLVGALRMAEGPRKVIVTRVGDNAVEHEVAGPVRVTPLAPGVADVL